MADHPANHRDNISPFVARVAQPLRAMNSIDAYYLWKTSDLAQQPFAVYMEAEKIAIDDRISARGLK